MADILYVITDLKVGGVPLHLHHLTCAMRDRGHRVAVVSLSPEVPVGESMSRDGIEVMHCGATGGRDYRVIGRLASIIRERNPELVHALLFHANVASRWAARKARFSRERVICEIQTVEVERKWHLWVDRFTHKGCRFTIGNSPSVIDHLHDKARVPRDRLRLVCGGIDADRIRSASPIRKEEIGLSENDRIVLWVGRLDPVKGMDHLVPAFAELPSELGAHLVLVGDGPIRGKIEQQVRNLGMSDRIHLLGSRNDVPSLLRSAEIFAFPSRTEGLPNALLEAMAAGCAIVTTNVAGCRDLIEDDRNGLMVPYGDTNKLHRALASLLTDFALADRLRQSASDSVDKKWSIQQTYDAYDQAYRDALA